MHRFFPALLALTLAVTTAVPAGAVTLLRDAELERGLRELAKPIFAAAGLNASRTRILVIDDDSLNAFVIDGSAIFLHSGLIMRVDRAEELQAVIAHEAAHIANGHMARRLTNMRNARTAAGLGLALAIAAGAASGNAEAGAGLAIGAQSSAQMRFLAHTRAEEASADQSGIRYMAQAGIDPTGAVTLLEIFRGQEALSVGRQDPYVQTHPLSRERLRAMEAFVAGYSGSARANPSADAWFALVQGKLSAFKRAPSWTLRRVGNGNDQVSLMRRAVAYHRKPDKARAIAEVDRLVALTPSNPYVHELRGQILLESREFGAAVNAYKRAVDLAPNQPLILGGYGRALLAVGQPRAAMDVLERARSRDPFDPRILRDLAQTYAQAGQNGMASLVTAERYALRGRLADAGIHAKRASDLLPRGSASWQRAMDVLRASEAAQNRRRRG